MNHARVLTLSAACLLGGWSRPHAQEPPPGPPGGFGPGAFMADALLKEADSDRDARLSVAEARDFAAGFLKDADKAGAGALDADALRRALNRRLPGPPGMNVPEDSDFGPGSFFGPALLKAVDSDADGELTAAELADAAERFVRTADADAKGGLDAAALARALGSIMPRPPGFGGPGGPPGGQPRKILKKYDADGDGRLNAEEREAAVAGEKTARNDRRGFGPPPGFGRRQEPAKPGPKVAKQDVPSFAGKPLYDPDVVRTLFLDFEGDDWESQLSAFHKTDVEVPATLTVDGRAIAGVGVHFRGMSSYFTVGEGRKRSLNVSIDFTDESARLEGYKTLNLLNSHEDPSFLRTVLFSTIAREYLPAPQANFVRVVVNGESWGLYVNVQQFDKIFLAENFGTDRGARWKVPGNPGADGGLGYHGEDLAPYKQRYELKSSKKGADAAWKALVTLCRTLDQTPVDRLEAALEPMLDIDGALKFLALDVALVNGDGYWTRASDYSIYLDPKGKFHLVPHDMNETFSAGGGFGPPPGFGPPGGGRRGGFGPGGPPPGGPGGFGPPPGFGGPGGGGVDLDPLVGVDAKDSRMPLRSRLLAAPALKARYLGYVKAIARKDLDWNDLGPTVTRFAKSIGSEVKADTRKLSSYEEFLAAVAPDPTPDPKPAAPAAKGRGPGRPEGATSLRGFADARRAYLLGLPAVRDAELP